MAQRYDTYKDSGVQWLRAIPGHWGCARLNKLASLKTGTTPKFFENELEGDTIDWYTPSDFTDDFKLADSQRRLNKVDFDGSGLSYVPSNSVLIIGIGGTAGKVACNKKECYSNQQITSLIPNERMYNLYMMLYFKSIRNILLETAHYTTLPILNNSFLAGVSLPIPPLSEQHAIVSYLDDKCGKIDEWLDKKQNEVEHLQELKQRVIADAVTRGLKPNVTLKQTKIPWLPEVPEHWEILRAKHMFNKEQRPVKEDDEIVTCFRDGEVTLRKNRRTTGFTEATDYSHYQHICKGDLVIHQMDAFAGSAGVSDSDGMGTPVLSVCTPKSENILNEYYAHIVRLMGKNGFILSLYRGIRERSSDFRFDTFANLWLPVPPIEEQKQIVAHITDKTSKIEKLISNINKEIEGIKEYKQRLISDVVTGQIKVC